MRTIFITLALACSLSACQSVPKERTNNCVCNWEILEQQNGAVT